MAVGRNKCVVKGVSQKKIISHDELMNRIRKSFYYGGGTSFEDMEVSRPLAEYASELFSEPHKGHSLNRLNFVTAGGVHASPAALIIALIYLDRLNATDPNYVRRITPSELFIVSMMISTKFYSGYDEEFYLSEWAEQGNVDEKRMKQLELEFLHAIDWNIYISNEQFFNKLESIEMILAQREGIRRGWLTYTELLNLLPSFAIAKFFLNNIAIMAVSYAASVMTIAGAFFIVSHIPGNALTHKHTNEMNTTPPVSERPVTKSNLCENILVNDDIDNDHANDYFVETATNRVGSCLAINIEEELKMLDKMYEENERIKSHQLRYNDNVIDLQQSSTTAVNNIVMDKDSIDWQDIANDENCRNNVKNQTNSILWYLLLRDEGKSLIEILPFDWLKFI